ncbi:preprotein translocase subunit SecE [Pirellulales bacterium]|nr:preprotein translocase subunit SecE [Pirellulales bacterium]
MVRCITFGLLSLFAGLGAINFAPNVASLPNWIPAMLILTGWYAAFRMCDQGGVADHLTGVDQETQQITWPNRSQMVHAATIGLSLMALLSIGLFCIDSLVAACLGLLG